MKSYRKRFVQLNMLLIGVVLLLMVALVAIYMYQDYYRTLESTMEQVVEPLDPTTPREAPAVPEAAEAGPSRQDQRNIMTVFYTPGEAPDVLSQTDLFDEDTLYALAEAVTGQNEHFGTLPEYRVIYYYTGNGSPYKIALASTGYISHSMTHLILVLSGIWVAAMGCFFLVSLQLSKVAVRPMEEAIRREKQFVADASHDLKTPLSVILANNSILLETPQATVASQSRWIDSTQQAAKSMQRLIGEMLTLADVERQDTPVSLEPVDFAAIAMKAALQLESVAYEKQVALETELPEQLILRSNGDYLQRIAASLLENAIKYEPAGGAVGERLFTSKRQVCLEIWNRDAVIAPEDIPHLFDRFYRGDRSRHSDTGSHGLGLSITREMVRGLRGDISVASRAGEGTVFSVRISL